MVFAKDFVDSLGHSSLPPGGWGNHPDKKMKLLTFVDGLGESVRVPPPRLPGLLGKPGFCDHPHGRVGQKNSSGYNFFLGCLNQSPGNSLIIQRHK